MTRSLAALLLLASATTARADVTPDLMPVTFSDARPAWTRAVVPAAVTFAASCAVASVVVGVVSVVQMRRR